MAVGENNLRKITQLYEHIKVHRKGLPRRLHTSGFVRVTRAQGHFRARLGLKTFCHTCVPFMRRAVSVLAFDWIFRHNILGQERSAPQKVAVPDVHVSFFFLGFDVCLQMAATRARQGQHAKGKCFGIMC